LGFLYYVDNKKPTFENIENPETPIHYYVITLGSEERNQNIEKQQEKMRSNIEIVNGVVGKDLTGIVIQSMTDPVIEFTHPNIDEDTQENRIKKNEIGCYLSHYQLYKKIAAQQSSPYSVILEDDFIINNDFETELNNEMKQMDQDFDLIYLYLHGHTDTEKITNHICVITEETGLYGTGGYLVNNKNIQKLIDETKVMRGQIDVQMHEIIRSNKIKAYKFCPYIVNMTGMQSTIQI
jgi:GR25 family glycosyltransferase involved in LPS biosynthesis